MFPSWYRRGGRAINKMPRSHLIKARPGWSVTDNPATAHGETFSRTDHPVCAFKGGFAAFYYSRSHPCYVEIVKRRIAVPKGTWFHLLYCSRLGRRTGPCWEATRAPTQGPDRSQGRHYRCPGFVFRNPKLRDGTKAINPFKERPRSLLVLISSCFQSGID